MAAVSPELQAEKERGLMMVIRHVNAELDKRVADGSLERDFSKMRLTQLMFHLNKIADVLKGPAIGLNINLPLPPKADALVANSALKLTEERREYYRRKNARIIEAEKE